jgi:hypothetical protein
MRVDTAQIYKICFSYENTEVMIPIAASTQEEAMMKLKTYLLGWVDELQTAAVPTISPVQFKGPNSDPGFGKKEPESLPVDPFALELRIEDMVKALIPLKKPKGAVTVERLVKDWTGFAMSPENYASIIAELGRISNEKK